ncbi:MAG: hypothetical protein JO331_00935 [Verrucomicrobia bacterium]|nr:hypothetical protein [Verrucomicrobiota bacterium]
MKIKEINLTRFWPLSLFAGLTLAFIPALHSARASTQYTFETINNNGDPHFNQLLGINNNSTIAGYFGDGVIQPNKGFTVVPPYTQASFTNENFPGSFQTQVVGINNASNPTTVGFWADTTNDNFGWVKQGNSFIQVVDPNTPPPAPGTTQVNQLLGVNDHNIAAGFYLDAAGNSHGYLYDIQKGTFTSVIPNTFTALSLAVTDINNLGMISGFYTDTHGVGHGFIANLNTNTFTSLDDPNGTNTMLLGLNNKGEVVGSFVNGAGVTNGLVYNISTNTWQTVNDPNQSSTPAFNVTGTTINGVNDLGQLVGFYSDGVNVDGFLATVVPEPSSLATVFVSAVAGLLIVGFRTRRSARNAS